MSKHVKDVAQAYPIGTLIKGSAFVDGIRCDCALYTEFNPPRLYILSASNRLNGVSPISGNHGWLYSYSLGPLDNVYAGHSLDLNSFVELYPKTDTMPLNQDLKGRWVKCLSTGASSIPWVVGDYKQIAFNDGNHVTFKDRYKTSIGNTCELMSEGFDPQKHEGTGKHISNYTQELQRGCFRAGSIVTLGGDRLEGGLYRSTANGYYYFLHNEIASHTRGCKPSESLPADCPYHYGWDIGNQATPFDQIKPMSFIPASVLVESWNEKPTEKKPIELEPIAPVSESLVGRYIHVIKNMGNKLKGHHLKVLGDPDYEKKSTINRMLDLEEYGVCTYKRIIDKDCELMPKGWSPHAAGGEVMAKKSDPLLDYLVVGMGKPAEIQPVVMFSRTKDKRVMAPLEAMQPVLQISKLKTNK